MCLQEILVDYTVHLSRSGLCAFGSISSIGLIEGQPPHPKEHRAMIDKNVLT